MDKLTERIAAAQKDNGAMDDLIQAYQPFIRSEAQRVCADGLEYEDRLSIAMLAFMQSVRQYHPDRGGFIGFASACIRNRLTDEGRKNQRRRAVIVPLSGDGDGQAWQQAENADAERAYGQAQERQTLRDEVEALGGELALHGITLPGLAAICPRQRRSRALCIRLAQATCQDAALRAAFQQHGRLAQKTLSERFAVSPKTIEKHRRYIVTLVVILSGDYPGIRAFLPREGDLL